jgi:hypothetical protein
MPSRPRLTPDDLDRIAALWKQRQTVPSIAVRLAFTYPQVYRALGQLGLALVAAKHPRRHARPVPVAVARADQQQLIARWQQSGLPVSVLAQHLNVDWRPLSHELREVKQMSARRLARLARLLTRLGY